jgi:haloacid dehalogenase-like hydrolase
MLDVDPSNVMAMGDGENDVEMAQMVCVCCAFTAPSCRSAGYMGSSNWCCCTVGYIAILANA